MEKKKKRRDVTFLDDVEPRKEEPQNQLIKIDQPLPAEIDQKKLDLMLKEDLQRSMQNIVPELPLIKILPAAACIFEFPGSEEGESSYTTKTFIGVIIDDQKCNAYWEKSIKESGGKKGPPDCSSLDAKRGSRQREIIDDKEVFGDCGTCYYNQYKTGRDETGNKTEGKACQNRWRLHIYVDGFIFPCRLTIPPTGLKATNKFINTLISRGIAPISRFVEFSLAPAQSGSGYDISLIQYKPLEQIPSSLYFQLQKIIKDYLPQIRGQEVLEGELENGFKPEEME